MFRREINKRIELLLSLGSLRMLQSQGGRANFFEVYVLYIEKKFALANTANGAYLRLTRRT